MRMTVKNDVLTGASITGSGRSAVFHKSWAEQLIAHIKVRTVTGTNTPTMTVKIQSSPDQVVWDDLGSVTFTGAGQQIIRETNFGKYIRLDWAVSGTNPVFAGTDMKIQCKG